ncbi:MAG: DUF4336 domain-containing protein [Cyanobacteria bacterium J06632_22]
MLRRLDQDLWVAEQPLRYLGVAVGARMTVVRLAADTLVVISAIEPDPTLVAQLNDLGRVMHIIVPNLYHSMFAKSFKAAFPQARLWAVPGLRDKQPDIPVDAVILPETSAWPGLAHQFFTGLKTLGLNGVDDFGECVFLHAASRTLIVTDAAFYFDETFPALTQFAMQLLGSYKHLRPSLLERVVSPRKAVLASLRTVLDWDFERVVMAHGSVIEHEGKTKLRQGYAPFLGGSTI